MLPLDILVVAPHPDDAEISVGGTIAVSVQQNLRVGRGNPHPANRHLMGPLTPVAAKRRNPPRSWALPGGAISTFPIAACRNTERGENWLKSSERSDHKLSWPRHGRMLIRTMSRRAVFVMMCVSGQNSVARTCTANPTNLLLLLHYFSIHLRIHPAPSVVLDISSHIETKMAAVNAFESQLITGRSPAFPTVIDDIRDRHVTGAGRSDEPSVNRLSIVNRPASHR